MDMNETARDAGNNQSVETRVESRPQPGIWVKPSLERLSLKDALSGGSTSHDGGPGSNPSS